MALHKPDHRRCSHSEIFAHQVDGPADLRAVAAVLKHLGQMLNGTRVFVDENVLDVEVKRLGPMLINTDTGFFYCGEQTEWRTECLLVASRHGVQTPAAKSIDQCNAKTVPPTRIERSLFKITNEIAD